MCNRTLASFKRPNSVFRMAEMVDAILTALEEGPHRNNVISGTLGIADARFSKGVSVTYIPSFCSEGNGGRAYGRRWRSSLGSWARPFPFPQVVKKLYIINLSEQVSQSLLARISYIPVASPQSRLFVHPWPSKPPGFSRQSLGEPRK